MKKIISVLICVALFATGIFVFAACSNQNDETTKETTVVSGGWANAESPVITDDFKAVFAKATETMTGVEYTPVAYLSSQIVAGKNHSVLCTATPTVPDATTTYAILTIYEDLEGNAEVTSTL